MFCASRLYYAMRVIRRSTGFRGFLSPSTLLIVPLCDLPTDTLLSAYPDTFAPYSQANVCIGCVLDSSLTIEWLGENSSALANLRGGSLVSLIPPFSHLGKILAECFAVLSSGTTLLIPRPDWNSSWPALLPEGVYGVGFHDQVELKVQSHRISSNRPGGRHLVRP